MFMLSTQKPLQTRRDADTFAVATGVVETGFVEPEIGRQIVSCVALQTASTEAPPQEVHG